MKLIAHRALIEGPNKLLENNPEQIEKVISMGYDCEIDIWQVDGTLYLGHDEPLYSIHNDFLNSNKFWIHAKNLDALYWLSNTKLNYFWHENDSYSMTSTGYIWTYPNKLLTSKSVCVMPESFMKIEDCSNLSCYGICSDYIKKISGFIKYE